MTEGTSCVVVGDPGVGQTCMLRSYLFGWDQIQTYQLAQQDEMHVTSLFVNEIEVDLRIWDAGGSNIRELLYLDADVFLVCFSMVQPESYESVYTKWYPELARHPKVPIVLVGLKHDLLADSDTLARLQSENSVPLTTADGIRLCQNIGAMKYMKCSALTGYGLEKVFTETARFGVSVSIP